MNTQNAWGFLGVGLAMWLLPLLSPALVEPTGVFADSTRALWLLVMGFVNAAVGSGWLMRLGWLRLLPRVVAFMRTALPVADAAPAIVRPAPAPEPVRLAA